MNYLLARFFAAVDAVIGAVIGAMVDAIEARWKEEEATPLCGVPTKGREQ